MLYLLVLFYIIIKGSYIGFTYDSILWHTVDVVNNIQQKNSSLQKRLFLGFVFKIKRLTCEESSEFKLLFPVYI